MKWLWLIGCIQIIFVSVICAQLPKTDVFLAEFKNLSSKPQLLSIKYLSGYNQNGYNNQARFFSNQDVYLTSSVDTSGFTDIYHLNISTNEMYRVTDTENISEFSPTPSPVAGQFTVVRIEEDGEDQSLWQYPTDRSTKGFRLLPGLKNIGYHVWCNKDTVALFLVNTPNKLAICNIKTHKTEIIAENIGRCIKTNQDQLLYFVQKSGPDLWELKSYHLTDKKGTLICTMPSGREDFEVLPNGSIIAGDGSTIKLLQPDKDKEWQIIADFREQNIRNINRIHVLRDKLIFINNKL